MSPRRMDFLLIVVVASVVAVVSARPYAGAWNDGSRLAAVESLVDRGTFAIDDSIFVRIPIDTSPYGPAEPGPHLTGTLDKLRIGGRFYSDKSPMPTVLLAASYSVIQRLTGLTAADSPATFCWTMNLLGGGLPYVAAVLATFGIAAAVGLPRRTSWLMTLTFALATVAPAYSRHINNHIMQLGIIAVLLLIMLRLDEQPTRQRWLVLGTLTGAAYTIDLGLGPPIVAAISGWAMYYCWMHRRGMPLVLFAAGALPWLVAHHAINFVIAGTVGPANARPEYLNWPGSPFDTSSMTGRWHHSSFGWFILYAIDLLVGQRGILGNNLPAYLALVGLPVVWHTQCRARPLVAVQLVWCVGGFLAYAATSNNYSGMCLTVRWFVPMLAPAFLLIALLLRSRPNLVKDLQLLATFGVVWAAAGWVGGPWSRPPLALYWIAMGGGLTAWAVWRFSTQSRETGHLTLQFRPPLTNNSQCATSPPYRWELPHGTVEESRRAVWRS